ncbi:hypothetical protein Glove_283g136 [Diversispora epigaea]|uniref:Zn(2)-C6 fungal-type domain-containing protein n=1 Tax=Diversispora epigaea TaxID=1348612 RepID=A0A397I7U5_9GLOM|nr:hypothetical protein Glove_283g136 [Diversispora epigaea]
MTKRPNYTENACTGCANAKKKCERELADICNRCKGLKRICVKKFQKKRGRKKKQNENEQNDIDTFYVDYVFSETEAPISSILNYGNLWHEHKSAGNHFLH